MKPRYIIDKNTRNNFLTFNRIFLAKMKHILSVTVVENVQVVCHRVVYALMIKWQLGVRMARPGPFYTGTSCLKPGLACISVLRYYFPLIMNKHRFFLISGHLFSTSDISNIFQFSFEGSSYRESTVFNFHISLWISSHVSFLWNILEAYSSFLIITIVSVPCVC